jgi:3-hydroxybutyryl-CoA dehydrogenase
MKIAIIGSGTMATGIIQVLLMSKKVTQLVVITRSEDKSINVKRSCEKYLSKLSRKGLLDPNEVSLTIEKLSISSELFQIDSSDIIIEAVAEDFSIKKVVFEQIKKYVTSSTIIASNTSSLSITAFSSIFDNPENVVGLHFFNPAPIMELVEVVVGHSTSKDVVNRLVNFTESLGKSPVVVNEAPGFVVNRMLIPMINEAVGILAEGVATAEDIDKAMKFGAHHPMGPLALADLIGNDVNLSIMDTLHSETGDPKYRAHPLLRKMVRADHLGRKTKKGFFEY